MVLESVQEDNVIVEGVESEHESDQEEPVQLGSADDWLSVFGNQKEKKGNDMESQISNLKAKLAKAVMEIINRYKEQAIQEGNTDPNAFQDYMTAKDLDQMVTAFLPIMKLEDIKTVNNTQQGKYLIGTLKQSIQVKGSSLLIRVGGGFSTLDAYLN